ncbi:MAG TPA: 50S ribosomal protein L23 [Fusobacteria bacterium]|nr:50S ribosomal protein L23 [Fusobacteriota bacterium]|tara:strand:+ start:25120 stop:25395 length:276 start_codon:yes stop_codon:yes gene_type:complete
MIDKFGIIKKPLFTEKSQVAKSQNNEFIFEVDRRANKLEIKEAVQALFGVKVKDVRTSIKKPEVKLRKGQKTLTKKVKKAVVKLEEGQTIS